MHRKDKIDCVIGTQFIVRASHSTAVLDKARDRPGTLSHANMWCKDECTAFVVAGRIGDTIGLINRKFLMFESEANGAMKTQQYIETQLFVTECSVPISWVT
jgi:hypothetical protein